MQAGKNEAAVAKYSEGLKLAPAGDTTLKLHKNLAACYIKLEKWDKAIVSCDAALNLAPTDVKALFRRELQTLTCILCARSEHYLTVPSLHRRASSRKEGQCGESVSRCGTGRTTRQE